MVKEENYKSPFSTTFNVGIIGFGPKGLYALERLLAQIKAQEITIPVAIHIFNQNQFFGAGNVYRNDQPPYLIMNYANKNIDIWSKELPIAIINETPNFSEWLAEKTGTPIETLLDGFASRAMVGNYLMESFAQLCKKVPSNVEIIQHITTIQKIVKNEKGYKLYSNEDESSLSIAFNKLMFTTGHLGSGAHFHLENLSNNCVEFIYPVSFKLRHIVANSKVAIQGFGLTSIDAILSLTEGRDGTFEKNTDGNLSYSASGKEPDKIYPFSRTGLPMVPRGIDGEDKSPLFYISEEKITALQGTSHFSIMDDILPLIRKEFKFNYYKVLFKKHQWELKYNADYDKINEQIAQFHDKFSSETRFYWDAFLNPFSNQNTLSHSEMHRFIKSLISEAEIGLNESPFIAAASTWRKISPVFNTLYSFAGLDAESQRLFDEFYFGSFNRIAYGPPVKNMKKIIALAEAGIVDFSFVRSPQLEKLVLDDGAKYNLYIGLKKIKVDYLINARVPRNESKGINSLYANLLKDGLVCAYTNTNDGQYQPGCVAIDFKGRPYDSDGHLQENITFYGTPTEGVTFDNDTLSRKRNNFASQWAHDISIILEKEQKKSKNNNERKYKLH